MSIATLDGYRVVDLGSGMPTALIAKFLRECGAQVTRVTSSSCRFDEVYPAYRQWHEGSKIVIDPDQASLKELIDDADICLLGGEDFPGTSCISDAATLAVDRPRTIFLQITGYPDGHADKSRAVDLLVQARSGIVFEHYSDRPIAFAFSPSLYGAALQGLAGLFAAIYERQCTGAGQVVTTSLLEGVLTWVGSVWGEAEHPTPAFEFTVPKDPAPLIFRCADGRHVHLVLFSAGSKDALYGALGIDSSDGSGDMPTADTAPDKYFGDTQFLARHIERWNSEELLEKIWATGMAAEPVLAPGEIWDDPQIAGTIVHGAGQSGWIGHPVTHMSHPAPLRPTPPFTRLRAIDFGTFLAGPLSTEILRDLGVDVIKVEPLAGDPARAVYRSFASVNRGKRAIRIDMKSPEGRAIAARLCLSADIVTNNFRPGVSQRLGVDATTLHESKPELIVLESSGYGPGGPDRAGFDMVFQALCGHERQAGGADNPPLWNRTAMIDYAAGMLGAIGLLQALVERGRTGAGTTLDTCLLSAGLFLMSDWVRDEEGRMAGPAMLNHAQTGSHPAEQLYRAADGWIAVSARDEPSAGRFASVLGLDALRRKRRSAWGADEEAEIAAQIAGRTVADILQALAEADVWAERCVEQGGAAILAQDSFRARGTTFAGQHETFGTVRLPGPLFALSRSEVRARGLPPALGQDSRAVLAELGYQDAEIEDFFARKIVA